MALSRPSPCFSHPYEDDDMWQQCVNSSFSKHADNCISTSSGASINISPDSASIFPPSESQKPRQRVSNADQKVFANPESFCDMFINHNSKFIFMAKSASVLGDFYALYHFVCHT